MPTKKRSKRTPVYVWAVESTDAYAYTDGVFHWTLEKVFGTERGAKNYTANETPGIDGTKYRIRCQLVNQ